MQILHDTGTDSKGKLTDSLKFDNFDNDFYFSQFQQTSFANWPATHIELGSHNPIKDKAGKRWKLFSGNLDISVNNLVNDTIILQFTKSNILYYISDLTPYKTWEGKQIAVKAH